MLISFDDLLNLPQVRIVDALLTETEITLQVEHSQHFAICYKCGARATEFFRNGEKLVLRHLPIFNRPSFWCCKPNAIAAWIAAGKPRRLSRVV